VETPGVGLDSIALAADLRHRIANGFQVIGGLVRLRLSGAQGEEARGHLTWLLDAITTVGLLQQRLAAADSATFQSFLREAAPVWESRAGSGGITLAVEAADELAIREAAATSLALIAHELVTNCVLHAFPDGRPGSVLVRLGSVSDGRQGELVVQDDGEGLPEAMADDVTGPAVRGLALVRMLAAQLGGSFEIGRAAGGARGTTARLRFSL
jgi:two-component sensor histidine kinase